MVRKIFSLSIIFTSIPNLKSKFELNIFQVPASKKSPVCSKAIKIFTDVKLND